MVRLNHIGETLVANCLGTLTALGVAALGMAAVGVAPAIAQQQITAYPVINGQLSDRPATSFRPGARLALCLQVETDSFVSIWDAAPNGQRSRLYPNSITHPDGENGAFVRARTERCIGAPGSGYQITIDGDHGLGSGHFFLLATQQLSLQLPADAFDIPDYGFSAGITAEPNESGGELEALTQNWLQYRVRE